MSDSMEKQLLLIVDDTPEQIDILVNILQASYEIKAAIDGARAIEIAATEPRPDMILLDIVMPGMNGYEVCQKLKADVTTADIPVIFITGSIDVESQKRGFELGAVDYITRPLSPPIVRARVKNHLQLYDQNRALEKKVKKRTADLEKSRLELIRSENHLRTLLNALPDLVWLKDPQGVYLSCNSKFEQFFQTTIDQIIGKNDYDFFDKDTADYCIQTDKKTIASGTPCTNEEEIPSAQDGHRQIVETIKVPMHDADGNLTGILGIARDITQRKRLEEQVMQIQKMEAIGTLAGGIAHDFNNILSAIIGYTELALISSSKQEEVQEHLNHIFKASMRAKELVKQILTSCRHIHQPQQPQTIKVGSMIKEALKLIQSTFPSTIQIHTEIASSGKMVIDPSQMHQIIMNLCTNAKHAMQEDGGVLTIKVTDRDIEPNDMLLNRNPDVHPGAYICLSVDDTGHGMEPDIMKRIFEPYFTTKEKDVGTGLGLAMVHGITKSCGGAIMLESHVGKGTTFTLYFPRMDSESLSDELEEHTALAKCPTGSGRILIVDDEVEILSLGHVVLEDLGYQVVTKTNGMDALQEFSKQPDFFDAVITDITMPQMSGDKLAIELLRIRPEIPIIACTGFSEKINEQKATAIGIKALLAKPYTWKQLTKTLRMVLDENEPL